MRINLNTQSPEVFWEELSQGLGYPGSDQTLHKLPSSFTNGDIRYNKLGSAITHFGISGKPNRPINFNFGNPAISSKHVVLMFHIGENGGLEFQGQPRVLNTKPFISKNGHNQLFMSVLSNPENIPTFQLKKNANSKLHLLFLNEDWLKELQPEIAEFTNRFPMVSKSEKPLMLLQNKTLDFNALFDLLNKFDDAEVSDKMIYLGELYKILGNYFSLILNLEKGMLKGESKVHIKDFDRIEALEKFLHEHTLSTLPCLDKLSMEFGMSKTKMCVLFKRIYGESLYNYYLKVKITKAKEMLSQTAKSIGEISDSLNIQNKSYFSRIFRKQVGVLPSDYRKAIISN